MSSSEPTPPAAVCHGQARPARAKTLLTSTRRRWPLLLVLCALSLTACQTGGPGSAAFENENDHLRRVRNDLQEEVRRLKQTNANLTAEIELLRQRLEARVAPLPEGLSAAAVPRLTRLEFGRFTAAMDEDGDGIADHLRIYLHTLDQQGRFLPVAATLDAQAIAIDPGRPPIVLGERHIDAAAFDAAYRAGLTGTHYTIEIPLTTAPPSSLTDITVKLSLRDAATGASIAHEKPIPASPRSSSQ